MTRAPETIVIVGLGYVGLGMLGLLAPGNRIVAVERDATRLKTIMQGRAPFDDPEIDAVLADTVSNIQFYSHIEEYQGSAKFIIVCTPTDFEHDKNWFDTSIVDVVVEQAIRRHPNATIVIKSTIPVGHIDMLGSQLSSDAILHSPEFLREGHSLADNRFPDRIVVGGERRRAEEFAEILAGAAWSDDVQCFITSGIGAEAIKLFSNSYLAMRVAYFNEVDTFCIERELDSAELIGAICADQRISGGYNEPSFGYGGYCFPKDTRQLLASFGDTPQRLIRAAVEANEVRKAYIASQIVATGARRVGFTSLGMKRGSANPRDSASVDIARALIGEGIEVGVLSSAVTDPATVPGSRGFTAADELVRWADLVASDRIDAEIGDLQTAKLFTRDPLISASSVAGSNEGSDEA